MAARLGISKKDVLDAAVEVDDEGTPLTVAKVASHLGCQPPSIYHHIPGGLQELRDHVTEQRTIDGWVWCGKRGLPMQDHTGWLAGNDDWRDEPCPGPHLHLIKGEEIEDA